MEVTIVGFDSYSYTGKDGQLKEGGNLYYIVPVNPKEGSGLKSGSVYVRAQSMLYARCKGADFSKSMPGKLIFQMMSNGTAVVSDVEFKF